MNYDLCISYNVRGYCMLNTMLLETIVFVNRHLIIRECTDANGEVSIAVCSLYIVQKEVLSFARRVSVC